MLTKYQIEEIMKNLPKEGNTAVEIHDEVLYTIVDGKQTRHGKVADMGEAMQAISACLAGTHTRHEVHVVAVEDETFNGLKEIANAADHLLNSEQLREIPEDYPPHLAIALKIGEAKFGIPALLLEKMIAAAVKGGCNCGYCLVNKMYPDASKRRTGDDPVEALKMAALEFIAMTKGPQKGTLCDKARSALRNEAAQASKKEADPFAGFSIDPTLVN